MKLDIFNKTKEVFGNIEKLPLIKKENDSEINNLKTELDNIIKGAQELQKQGDILKIGVVGQVKAGKSSFLNALIFEGKDILPKAVTPMTAGLTVLGYADKPRFVAEFYNQSDWETIECKANEFREKIVQAKREASQEEQQLDEQIIIDKLKENTDEIVVSAYELVTRCSSSAKALINAKPHQSELNSLEEWQSKLKNYVGADGEFTSVTKCLYLYLPDEKLKGIEIVDTPGVNDPVVSRGERTNEFLRSCHGVFLLSNAESFCTSTDMAFLKERVYDQGIEAVVVLASKYDSALPGIASKYHENLQNATDGLTKDLRMMLDTALGNKGLNFKPTLDHVSGICYNLYKKGKNQWSEEEKHIADQLTKRYPSFMTAENENYIFETLANIGNIQTKYVAGEFTDNKTKIIQAKQYAYVNKNKANVLERLKSLQEDIDTKKKTLEKMDSSDVDSLKSNAVLVENIAKKSTKLISGISDKINNIHNSFLNSVPLSSFNSNLYLVNKEYHYEIKDGFLFGIGRTKGTKEIKLVDTTILESNLEKYFEEYLEKSFSEWKKIFSKKGTYAEEIRTELTKNLTEETNVVLDPSILLEAFNKTIESVDLIVNCFPKDTIIELCKGRIKHRMTKPSRKINSEFENKNKALEHFDSISRDEQHTYKNITDELLKDFKEIFTEKITNEKDNIFKRYVELSKNFEQELKKTFNEITAEYAEKISRKNEVMEEYDKAIELMKQAQNLYSISSQFQMA